MGLRVKSQAVVREISKYHIISHAIREAHSRGTYDPGHKLFAYRFSVNEDRIA